MNYLKILRSQEFHTIDEIVNLQNDLHGSPREKKSELYPVLLHYHFLLKEIRCEIEDVLKFIRN